jgi:hypothetical protein
MVFFFHHYEIPLILYQEQLVRVVSAVHQEVSLCLLGYNANIPLIVRRLHFGVKRRAVDITACWVR